MTLELVLMTFGMLVGTSNMYLYCFYGKYTTHYYAAFADCLYESNWMTLPVELQRLFVVMIAYAQRPLDYRGFGFVTLNLELFTKVCFCVFCIESVQTIAYLPPQMLKTVVTYYLMFKTLTDK